MAPGGAIWVALGGPTRAPAPAGLHPGALSLQSSRQLSVLNMFGLGPNSSRDLALTQAGTCASISKDMSGLINGLLAEVQGATVISYDGG